MKFKVGDICITQNSRAPLLNDNHQLVVVANDSGIISYDGEHTPYHVRRIDGRPHGFTIDRTSGALLRLPQVIEIVGLSKSSIYAKIKDGTFPPPIHISNRAIGWLDSVIEEWIEQRINESNSQSKVA